jgi:hypothetical protein
MNGSYKQVPLPKAPADCIFYSPKWRFTKGAPKFFIYGLAKKEFFPAIDGMIFNWPF